MALGTLHGTVVTIDGDEVAPTGIMREHDDGAGRGAGE
jgi:hypothetical protein